MRFVGLDIRDLIRLTDTLISTAGRGYPDISAQAMNYQIVLAGNVRAVDGTSAACPVRFPTTTRAAQLTLGMTDRSWRHLPSERLFDLKRQTATGLSQSADLFEGR